MRVLSLLPAATEIVAALGGSPELVGVTHECDWPPTVTGLPRVTVSAVDAAASAQVVDAAVRALGEAGTPVFALDSARIVALRPDVIVTQALCDVCAVSETDVRALARRMSPEPRVVTLGGTTLDGILADIGAVALALGVQQAGERLVDELTARMRRVHETLKGARAPRPRVAVIEWSEPTYAAGHWVPEMVRRAGGTDVLAQPGMHSCRLSPEAVRAADPEIVLVAPCGYDVARAAAEAEQMLARPEWTWARHRTVWALDANGLVSRPGPRLVDGIEAMTAIFAPALFPAPAPAVAVPLRPRGA
ncbi:MAG TPA: ABC transporter substrate-binding protein [Gemmatimonadaceae bacterium]|jgi:iron complex transport system substrate-binding protein|nr:ABC transporter substrate-binding protein [Gemmatimonadaceae bacterium]